MFVFDAKGAVVESRVMRLAVSGEARNVAVKLALKPGDYVAKTLLRIGNSVGFARLPLRLRQD